MATLSPQAVERPSQRHSDYSRTRSINTVTQSLPRPKPKSQPLSSPPLINTGPSSINDPGSSTPVPNHPTVLSQAAPQHLNSATPVVMATGPGSGGNDLDTLPPVPEQSLLHTASRLLSSPPLINATGPGGGSNGPGNFPSVFPWPISWTAVRRRLLPGATPNDSERNPNERERGEIDIERIRRDERTSEWELDVFSIISFIGMILYQLFCFTCILLMMFLPLVYFRRVEEVLQDADLQVEEIAELAVEDAKSVEEEGERSAGERKEDKFGGDGGDGGGAGGVGRKTNAAVMATSRRRRFTRLKEDWKNMIDDFIGEWKTLNVVAAVLVPGVLTLFQVETAANDPVTRNLTFWSLVLSLWCLIYASLYVIHFTGMRRTHTIVEWAMEAQDTGLMSPFWNIWVLLSLPAVSLAWSILIFMITVLWFMWRSRAQSPLQETSFPAVPSTESGFHIFISTAVGVGTFFLTLILWRFQMPSGGWRVRVKEIAVEARSRKVEHKQGVNSNR